MKVRYLIYSTIFLLLFILLSKNEITNANALIVENNPFYGLSNEKIKIVESPTADKLINVKLEYAPESIGIGSPEFFKATLYYRDSNKPVLHADTDIIVSKNGNELYKASSEFSQPFVHTPNGIVLSSYKFPDSGQYIITAKILGIKFMPVNPKQVDFMVNVTESNNKYNVEIGK